MRRLQPVSTADRAEIFAAPRTRTAHRALLGQCLFLLDSAAHLAPRAPQVLLLSEMDHGMARTKQRHTTEDMARALGVAYAFGVEFFEMGLGGATERAFCEEDANRYGWHGNAILSAAPFEDATMFRLDDHGHWFGSHAGGDVGQGAGTTRRFLGFTGS